MINNNTPIINMRSSATSVKGQGVGSCYMELMQLFEKKLNGYNILINSKKKSDIYHYHTINFGFYCERLLKRNNSVSICYVHFLPETLDDSLNLPKLARVVFYKYLISFYNSMDYLVAVNPDVVEKLKKYNINNPKILYIPNFVSSDNFYIKNIADITSYKIKKGIPIDKKIVLGVGQLQERKGVIDFINIAKKMPEIHFLWAGGFCFGKMSSGYNTINSALEDLPPNISFLGIVDREEMCSLYNACDIFFLPSYDELFPMAILEALSCGKPTLLRNIDVYNDILDKYCIFGNDNEHFIDILSTVINDDGELKKWHEKSLQGSKFYSDQSVLEMWEKLYSTAYNNKNS